MVAQGEKNISESLICRAGPGRTGPRRRPRRGSSLAVNTATATSPCQPTNQASGLSIPGRDGGDAVNRIARAVGGTGGARDHSGAHEGSEGLDRLLIDLDRVRLLDGAALTDGSSASGSVTRTGGRQVPEATAPATSAMDSGLTRTF